MTKWTSFCFLIAMLTSCGLLPRQNSAVQQLEFPDELKPKSASNETVIEGEGTLAPEIRVALDEFKQKDLAWTDPDNLFGDVSNVKKRIDAPKREIWQKTEAAALKSAMREGKCLMIWFTDSKRSPLCKTLSNELLGKSDFGDWANQNVIRFRVDQSALASTDVKMDAEVAAASHVLAMKSKYKVKGSPTILLLSPRGNQIARYRGYKPGTSATLWGQLKYSVGIGNKEYQDWLKSLQKQGYRIWRDQNNRQILAKLVKYNQGELSLIEPDGGQLQTKEKSLSAEDRAWIAAEKKKRGIE